jgi:hypothetical protein
VLVVTERKDILCPKTQQQFRHPDNLLVYFLCELVHGSVGRGADKDGAAVEPHQLVDDGGGCNSLTSPRRSLDQGQGTLECVLHCINLNSERKVMLTYFSRQR